MIFDVESMESGECSIETLKAVEERSGTGRQEWKVVQVLETLGDRDQEQIIEIS